MLPRRSQLDPHGYYDCLGVAPTASPDAIVTAFRRKARVLHPDVPGTGDTGAFVAARQAYDVLSNREQRETYDQAAREAAVAAAAFHPATGFAVPSAFAAARQPAAESPRPPEVAHALARFRPYIHNLTIPVALGLACFLCLGIMEVVQHLRSPPRVVSDNILPNAAPVQPLSPGAARAVLYGPAPVQLAGIPNFYVVPSAGATVLWRKAPDRDAYIPVGQLPPFSSVQALRLSRQTGLVEVRFNAAANAFIDARQLMPGDAAAARRAYCGYNAGPNPRDGELLELRAVGDATIQLENRAVQPVVVKLRDAAGMVVAAIFLGPGSHAAIAGVPDGRYRPDFAIGELWSRACNSFAAGMRARRMQAEFTIPRDTRLVIPPDTEADAVDITDRAFEQD